MITVKAIACDAIPMSKTSTNYKNTKKVPKLQNKTISARKQQKITKQKIIKKYNGNKKQKQSKEEICLIQKPNN